MQSVTNMKSIASSFQDLPSADVKTKQYLKPNNVKDSRTATDFVHSNREVVTNVLYANHAVEARGAFYYARDSGNFGRKSNGKVRFSSF